MLPHLRARAGHDRAIPSGIARQGFLQKDVSKGVPAWLERVEVPKKDGVVHHLLVNDRRSLESRGRRPSDEWSRLMMHSQLRAQAPPRAAPGRR
jgi:hypothetical protein